MRTYAKLCEAFGVLINAVCTFASPAYEESPPVILAALWFSEELALLGFRLCLPNHKVGDVEYKPTPCLLDVEPRTSMIGMTGSRAQDSGHFIGFPSMSTIEHAFGPLQLNFGFD